MISCVPSKKKIRKPAFASKRNDFSCKQKLVLIVTYYIHYLSRLERRGSYAEEFLNFWLLTRIILFFIYEFSIANLHQMLKAIQALLYKAHSQVFIVVNVGI